MSDEITILRDVNSAASLLAEYGGTLPAEVEAARGLYRSLRQAPPVMPSDDEVGALALDETPARAEKALASARTAQDVHRMALRVAAVRANRALIEHADEVVAAVLGAPALVAAVDEIRDVVRSGVNPAVARHPAPGTPDDDVVAAARLRRAEAVIERASTALASNDSLGFYVEPNRTGALWLDPSGVEDFTALNKALRGVRRGYSDMPVMITRPGVAGPFRDDRWVGIVSAAASAVPGVEYRLVSSYDEYVERVRRVEAGLVRERRPADAPAPKRPRAVVL